MHDGDRRTVQRETTASKNKKGLKQLSFHRIAHLKEQEAVGHSIFDFPNWSTHSSISFIVHFFRVRFLRAGIRALGIAIPRPGKVIGVLVLAEGQKFGLWMPAAPPSISQEQLRAGSAPAAIVIIPEASGAVGCPGKQRTVQKPHRCPPLPTRFTRRQNEGFYCSSDSPTLFCDKANRFTR